MVPLSVVHFSTGLASAEIAFREAEAGRPFMLLTADTSVEDDDNWRFAAEVHAALGKPEWVVLRDGRTPMQVGRDERCVPNNRMAVCSKILKRQVLDRYCKKRWTPDEIIHLLGYDWTEPHRARASAPLFLPYKMDCPLTRPPWWQKGDFHHWSETRHIEPPRIYLTGAPHANCGGACVRGG